MALNLVIGSYRYLARTNSYSLLSSKCSNPYYSDLLKSVESYDHLLYQSLHKIFHEHCLSNSELFKEFIRGSQLKSMIKPILDQEPVVSKHFSKEELENLSLLWITILSGYNNSAELLVRSGADVNELFGRHDPQVIDQKWSVLHLLLQMDPSPENERLIHLVTDQGADLQARDYKERTVLYYAVMRGRVQMTKMLLEKGADVNAADNDGMTPLLAAVSFSCRANELVALLIKHGADVLTQNIAGENVLHRLVHAPLEQAVNLARFLIEKGASLESKESFNDYQPIHRATQVTKIELVNLFLDHGANVNAPAKYGESPLYVAAQYCKNKMAKGLIKRGANVNLRTSDGSTVLHAACTYAALYRPRFFHDFNKWEKFIRRLVSAGADVFAEDNNGKTPFAIISSDGNVEQPGARLMIGILVLKKALQPTIELKDERIIERHPTLCNYYRDCLEEIERMKSTRLINTCTFFQLLTKSKFHIAAHMRNPEFGLNYRAYDRREFHMYAEDIRRAFDRAQAYYDDLLQLENMIKKTFHNRFPYHIVSKTAHYILIGTRR